MHVRHIICYVVWQSIFNHNRITWICFILMKGRVKRWVIKSRSLLMNLIKTLIFALPIWKIWQGCPSAKFARSDTSGNWKKNGKSAIWPFSSKGRKICPKAVLCVIKRTPDQTGSPQTHELAFYRFYSSTCDTRKIKKQGHCVGVNFQQHLSPFIFFSYRETNLERFFPSRWSSLIYASACSVPAPAAWWTLLTGGRIRHFRFQTFS